MHSCKCYQVDGKPEPVHIPCCSSPDFTLQCLSLPLGNRINCRGRLRAFLKNRLDAPPPHEIVQSRADPHTAGKLFVMSEIGIKLQAKYQEHHGVRRKKDSVDLPQRRQRKVPAAADANPRTAKALKRARESQLANLEPRLADADSEVVEGLEAVAAQAAKRRKTQRQADLAAELQSTLEKKAAFVQTDALPDADPDIVRKLAEHRKERKKMMEKITSIARQTMATALEGPSLPDDALVILSDKVPEEDREGLKRRLFELGRAQVVMWPSDRDTAVQVKICMAALKVFCVVWLCPDGADEEAAVFEPASRTFACCARLCGGWFAGDIWLQACFRERRLLQPLVKLRSAVKQEREVCLHKSLADEKSPAAKAIALIDKVMQEGPILTKWVVHGKAKQLLRA